MHTPSFPPPSSGGPAFAAVRAAFTQAALAAVDTLDDDTKRRVLAALPTETRTRVADASRLEWLPVELDMAVTEAITAALGPTRCSEFWKRSLLDTLETPILKPILDGAVGIFGLAPNGLLRWAPRVWDALYRNAGTMTVVARGPSSARIACESLAPALVSSGAFIEALRASLEALFTLTRTKGDVRIAEMDLEGRRAVYALSWGMRTR